MFKVLLSGRAVKAFRDLAPQDARRVRAALDALGLDPFASPHIAPLHGELAELHRVRVGGLRIVVEIRTATREVFVHALGSRGDIYR